MAAFLSPTALRAALLAVFLACVAAFAAPMARGESRHESRDTNHEIGNTAVSCLALVPLADEWSWHEFVKFWQRQGGSMTGVVGTVMLVGAGAVIMVLYKGKG